MRYLLLLMMPFVLVSCAVSEPCKRFENEAKEAGYKNTGTLKAITAEYSAQYEYHSCLKRHS